jgi:RNA-directed DNA polymerase
MSNDAGKAIRQEIRRWRINVHSDKALQDIASFVSPIVRGCNYYGRFYKSWLYRSLRKINEYLVRWARRKFKRLRTNARRAWRWLRGVQRRAPALFAHWTFGAIA